MCIKYIKNLIEKLKLKYKRYKNKRYDVIKYIDTPVYYHTKRFELYENDSFIEDSFDSSYSDSDIDLSY